MDSILKWILITITSILVGVTLYPFPAMLTLPGGIRSGLEQQTLSQAVDYLRGLRNGGWDLVEDARVLVSERMQYSRRNSHESASTAFERGYGFCQQQAFALVTILRALGFEAQVVHAFHNRFPNGKTGGHAWVELNLNGEIRYIDTIFYNADEGKIDFEPLSPVKVYSPVFRIFARWGGAAVNAHRFYLTGKDWD